jgi:PKD repeat protein
MRLKSLILALCAVFAFSAFAAASAVAVEGPWEDFKGTLSYSGSSSFSGTSLTTDLLDTTHSNTFTCSESSVSGTAEPSGTTNAGPLMHLTSTTWNKGSETCTASFGIKFAVTEAASATKPWLFDALYRLTANPKHHFLGLILNVHAVLKGTECELEVNGHIPALVLLLAKGGTQPEMDFDFNSAVNTNSVNLSSSLTVTILKESGLLKCGTAKTGDLSIFDGVYEETAGPTSVTLE